MFATQQADSENRCEPPALAGGADLSTHAPDAAMLLARMQSGDRKAASDFFTAFGPQIRRRVSGKLGPHVRRIFDSQEILSTVSRRLDRMIFSGDLRAVEVPQFWALVFSMVDIAVLDKVRVFSRLRAAESGERALTTSHAAHPTHQLRAPTYQPVLELEEAFDCLGSDVDREVLALWLEGTPQLRIAHIVRMTPAALRQRWRSIRLRLHSALSPGVA